MKRILAGLALVIGCAACGSEGGDQVFTEPCDAKGYARHDFGTTDSAVLARVRALTGWSKNAVNPTPDGLSPTMATASGIIFRRKHRARRLQRRPVRDVRPGAVSYWRPWQVMLKKIGSPR